MGCHRTPENVERAAKMAAEYADGRTLQEIGTDYGLTRERVRQIIKPFVGGAAGGGITVRSERKRKSRAALKSIAREVRSLKAYGCAFAVKKAIQGPFRVRDERGPIGAYRRQQQNAHTRGIAWEFTLPDWWAVWQESGKWEQRGRDCAANYVMARKSDAGPYAPWNVYITTMGGNVADYQATLKKRGIPCKDGYRRLPGNPNIAAIGVQVQSNAA